MSVSNQIYAYLILRALRSSFLLNTRKMIVIQQADQSSALAFSVSCRRAGRALQCRSALGRSGPGWIRAEDGEPDDRENPILAVTVQYELSDPFVAAVADQKVLGKPQTVPGFFENEQSRCSNMTICLKTSEMTLIRTTKLISRVLRSCISSINDNVYGVIAYCPLTDLANADADYEWTFKEIRAAIKDNAFVGEVF